MTRIDIRYGGGSYSVSASDPGAYKASVLESVAAGRWAWLDVDYGEGRLEPAAILIGPGVPITLIIAETHFEPSANDGKDPRPDPLDI